MSVPNVNASKKMVGKEPNDLVHHLKPKTFVKMFTKNKCTFEENIVQEILKYICALRNSGGGKLTILFTETCSTSAVVEKCVEIIKNAANEVLSDTEKADFISERTFSSKIVFHIKGSKEIVTMKYNVYVMTDGEAKLVPSTTSAADVKSFLYGREEQNSWFSSDISAVVKIRSRANNFPRARVAMKHTLKSPSLSPIEPCVKGKGFYPSLKSLHENTSLDQVELVKDQQVTVPTTKLLKEAVKFRILEDDKLTKPQNSVAYRITLKTNKLLAHVSAFANHHGGELYYGISSDGTVCGEMMLETEIEEIRGNVEKEIASMVCLQPVVGIHQFWQIAFLHVEDSADRKIKDQGALNPNLYVLKISVNPCQGAVFVEDPESYHVVENCVKRLAFSKWISCLQDSTEALDRTAFFELKENKKAIDGQYLPVKYQTFQKRQDWLLEEDKPLKWMESFKIVDANQECNECHLEIVCKFGKVPRTADVVDFFGEGMLPLITYQECSKHKLLETNIFKENAGMYEKFMDELARLEWVESFKIVDANKECDERHLEIVCKLGKVPITCDIVNIFGGKNILPFITYKEYSKREWFKTNILGENSGRKKKYKNELASLSWVKDFYIGVASEPEKSWQMYITCAQNKVPSMVDLKKLFGVNIASFVDFIQDSNPNEKSLPSPCLLRGPRTGDKLCVEVEDGRYPGTIGILSADEKHYATTCYHVCFKRDLPEDINEVHKILKNDCAKENSRGCQDANCVYRLTDEEERLLGQFCHGLYDDDHDIALIKLEPSLNCADAVKFLGQESIEPKLANIEEVDDMFYDMDGKVPVEKFGSATGITNGQLFLVDGGKQFISTDKAPCYRIEEIDGQAFAKKGDSGSLVYLLYNGKRIPFGYVSMAIPELKLYGCRNLLQSIKELIHNIQPCLKDH